MPGLGAFEAVTLDHLRTFVAVVDEGSFSAAARRLRRVQSAVSQSMATFEGLLGVQVWDRSTKVVRLTDAGHALLASARAVLGQAEQLGALARDLAGGLEAGLSVCVDSLFPVEALVALARSFRAAFPSVHLRIDTETMGAVAERVRSGACDLGVVSPAAFSNGLECVAVGSVLMIPVVARAHPLAQIQGPVTTERLADEVQIVLSERGERTSPDQAVLSRQTWRVTDLETKRALIRSGLGWGNLPEHLVTGDLAEQDLVRIAPVAWDPEQYRLTLSLAYVPASTRGPAMRWLANQLPGLCLAHGIGVPRVPSP